MDVNAALTTEKPTDLTPREQEILNLLLAKKSPKEIAHTLNISNDTVLAHQKNLYRKLDVHSINELLTKYSKANGAIPSSPTVRKLLSPKLLIPVGIAVIALFVILFLLISSPWKKETSTQGVAAVFTRWLTFEDDLGSYVSVTPKIEFIQEQYLETYTISGYLDHNNMTYTGTIIDPDPSTLEAMKKMTFFSFTVLGDGKTYTVMLTTTDTREEGGLNHYRKEFKTKKDEITTFTFNVNELAQSPYYGKQVPFIQNNIESLQFQAFTSGEFNLKVWDIRFIP